jgi:predicted phosphodiesterase
MRLLSYDMPKNWNYFLFGDTHIGARLTSMGGFRKLVKKMQGKYHGVKANYGLHHGDVIEAVMIDDKRFALFETREQSIFAQMAAAHKALHPIKKRLLAILDGNHERKLRNFGPVTHKICKDLKVPYDTTSCHITFTNKGKPQFRHFATHGNGTISSIADDPERRKLNWRLSLKRKLREKASCELASMGHTHKLIISKPTETLYLTAGKERIKHHMTGLPLLDNLYKAMANDEYIHPDYRFYVNTGSFLRLYGDDIVEDDNVPLERSKLGSGYAENANYDPVVLGYAVALIRDNRLVDVVQELL